jgi:hypothetical protein
MGWKHRKRLKGDGGKNGAFIDGVCAWMQGWRDVEESFRIRAQARNQRREMTNGQTSDMQATEQMRAAEGMVELRKHFSLN